MKGITGRWVKNTLGITALVVVTAILIASLLLRSSVYRDAENALVSRVNVICTYIDTVGDSYGDFYSVARMVAQDYEDANMAELELLDASGHVLISSGGFVDDALTPTEDYAAALSSENGVGVWHGKIDQTGEKVLSAAAVVYNDAGRVIGGVRLTSSLRKVDLSVTIMILLLCLVGIVVLTFSILSGIYFVNSIVIPVNEITNTAKEIACGDYDVRIERKFDDEIGELTDTINDLAEGLTEADRVKNDFISTVSHELRTPLTAIQGWGETLMSAGDDRALTEKGLSVIVSETSRLSKMVEELLDFSRLQSGRLTMKMGPCDVLAELQEAVLTYEPRANEERKTLTLEEPAEELPIITADGDRIRQVFINIIDNAVKYSDEGGHITVTAESGSGFVTVTVADDGCGIPDDQLAKVGQKFYKANFTRRGSGIGLATCDEIVRLHNGMLGIESKEGEGTRVSVALPVEQQKTEAVNS